MMASEAAGEQAMPEQARLHPPRELVVLAALALTAEPPGIWGVPGSPHRTSPPTALERQEES